MYIYLNVNHHNNKVSENWIFTHLVPLFQLSDFKKTPPLLSSKKQILDLKDSLKS